MLGILQSSKEKRLHNYQVAPADNIEVAKSIMRILPTELILKIAYCLIEIDRWVYYDCLKLMGLTFPGLLIRRVTVNGKKQITCSTSNLVGTGSHSVKKYLKFRFEQLECFRDNFRDLEFGSLFDVGSCKKEAIDDLVSRCQNIILRCPDTWLVICQSYENESSNENRVPISLWASKVSSLVFTFLCIEHIEFHDNFNNLKYLTIEVPTIPSNFFEIMKNAIKFFNPRKTCLILFKNETCLSLDTQYSISELSKFFPNLRINTEINASTKNKYPEGSLSNMYIINEKAHTIQDSLVSLDLTAVAYANYKFDYTWLERCPRLHKLALSFHDKFPELDQDYQIAIASNTLKLLKLSHMNYRLRPYLGLNLGRCPKLTSLKLARCKISEQMTKYIPNHATYIELRNCQTVSGVIQLPLELTILEFIVSEDGKKYPFPHITNLDSLKHLRLIYYGISATYTPEKNYWMLKKKNRNIDLEFYRYPEKRPIFTHFRYKWAKLERRFEEVRAIQQLEEA